MLKTIHKGVYIININNKEKLLDFNYIKEVLYYNKEEGDFYWLEEKKGRVLDEPAGTRSHSGYRTISVNGHYYAQHRLAFFWMTGEWPPEYVDHIDGNPGNNVWSNLRLATAAENSRNRKRVYGTHTGVKGVVKDWRSDTWNVHTMVDGKVISRGPFFSYQQACKEYDKLAQTNFGEFARTEVPREQRARFKTEEATKAVEEFIKNKTLINGVYKNQ